MLSKAYFIFVALLGIFSIVECKPFLPTDDGSDEGLIDDQGIEFQGDIFINRHQMALLFSNNTSTKKVDKNILHTGMLDEAYRWPKNREGLVQVPYVFALREFSE